MSEVEQQKILSEIWVGDKLFRQRDAEILRVFTIGQLQLRENAGETRTYVLNLDAKWGAGKTFFLSRLKEHLEVHNHIAIYVNAWENDHSNDPFVTVVDQIQSELLSQLSKSSGWKSALEKTAKFRKSAAKIIGGAALSGGKHLLSKYIGDESVGKLKELLANEGNDDPNIDAAGHESKIHALQKSIESGVDAAGEEVLSHFRSQKVVRNNFKSQLKVLGEEVLRIEGIQAPIFILIDELDRCRPRVR
ncbi:P-loop NTPase fold protein, partial [Marivita geojedonensis]